ncbi:FadR/GntR family transcriptional regulator [Vibrio methylphosphonaticus]|uniref:FadR/GntR family transcriptional regulator n=1 Tax=Vibrio methylphosphonaticus TaxID=2946866 RepID=UPI00202A170E|nr:GntR family transcriptional regulator [Vibrio methylphosphonaticus]MCL9774424.1 GntR family transcriptional regulator [Vibrio methylphosphonaticus]
MERQKSNIYNTVCNDIAKNIITGKYNDGVFPTEMELSNYYSVSRNSIREALKTLSSKGLLCSKQKSGTKVTPRSDWNFLDPQLYEWFSELPEMSSVITKMLKMQGILIPEACADAAINATSEQRVHLSKNYQRLSYHLSHSPENNQQTKKILGDYYKSIFIASNNELFSSYAKILDIIYSSTGDDIGEGRCSKIENYQKLYNSIMVADEDSARKAAKTLFY